MILAPINRRDAQTNFLVFVVVFDYEGDAPMSDLTARLSTQRKRRKMKDQYIPPWGADRPRWVINDVHYRDGFEAERAVRDQGMSAVDATDYVRMLVAEYNQRSQTIVED